MTHSEPKDEYGQLAPYYDALLDPILMRIRTAVCRIALHEGFRDMLDVCCGTGRQAGMLAGLGFRVSGVDLSPAMLDVALKNNCSNVNFYLGDASRLHFPDRSFDAVVISFALHEKPLDTRDRIVGEIKRVVRPGGKILIVDYLSPSGLMARIAHLFVSRVERMAGKDHHNYYRCFMKAGGLQGLTVRHGLRAVSVRKFFLGSTGLALFESR